MILDPTSRLRLATRIHFALLRQFGTTVPVSDLLDGGGEGQEAMWVCAASGNAELAAMARELARANKRLAAPPVQVAARALEPAAPRRPGRVPQETAWAQDTSGFGITLSPELAPRPNGNAATPGWFVPLGWLRRSTAR